MSLLVRGTQLRVEESEDGRKLSIIARLHEDLDGAVTDRGGCWSEVSLTFAVEGNLSNLISALRVMALRLGQPLSAYWEHEYIPVTERGE